MENTEQIKQSLIEDLKKLAIWQKVFRLGAMLGVSLTAIMNDVSVALAGTPGPTETPIPNPITEQLTLGDPILGIPNFVWMTLGVLCFSLLLSWIIENKK